MGLQALFRVPDPHSPSYPFMGVVPWDEVDLITEEVYSLLERKEHFYTQSRPKRRGHYLLEIKRNTFFINLLKRDYYIINFVFGGGGVGRSGVHSC